MRVGRAVRNPRRARHGILAAGMLSLSLAACRDDPAEFRLPPPPEPPEGFFQLTLSPFHDAGPAWSLDGTEVLYSAGQTDLFPDAAGAIVAVPANGGQARAVARAYQEGLSFPNVVAPALSPDGQRLATVELRSTFPLVCLPDQVSSCGDFAPSDVPSPELGLVVVAVRALDGSADGPEFPITFDDARTLEGNTLVLRADPYQRLYSRGSLPFRPTWSPDSRRVAFADGDALRIWTPGAGEPESVPNTAGTASAAWSPDGETIAFVLLEEEPLISEFCSCTGGSSPDFSANRRVNNIALSRLMLLDVASGGISELEAGGRDPAWSPDGRFLYVWRLGAIWRIPADGSGDPVRIQGTEGARLPAVSPDGTRLAVTIGAAGSPADIWIVPLSGANP